MKEIDPGHDYLLDSYDGDQENRLIFMKREGDGYLGNVGVHPGTNCQEVIRTLIARVKYLDGQAPCHWNKIIIAALRICLLAFEGRAAERHNRQTEDFDGILIEGIPTCYVCGHIRCQEKHYGMG